MPQNSPFGNNHKETSLFNGLGEDPHDDETDQEIDLDVEESDDDDYDDDDERWEVHKNANRHLPTTSSDLLTKLTSYLAHLPKSPNPAVTKEAMIEAADKNIFVPLPTPTGSKSNRSTTTSSATKKHRKEQRTKTTRSKPSRKAHPKNSY